MPTTSQHFVRWSWKECIGKSLNYLRPGERSQAQILGPFESCWRDQATREVVDRAHYTLHLGKNGHHFLRFEHCAGTQDIRLAWLPCSRGGGRWLMLCPYTGRRCWVLYKPLAHPVFGFGAPGVFRMRYSTENEDRLDRATTQLLKLRKRLGDTVGWLEFPVNCLRRPPRMHRTTFNKLRSKAAMYEAVRETELRVLTGRAWQVTGDPEAEFWPCRG